jgi:hypothetical protein
VETTSNRRAKRAQKGYDAGHHIQPYHMNGLNWRLAAGGAERGNITVVPGFMPAWWAEEYGISFGRAFHLDPDVHRGTVMRMSSILQERFGDVFEFPEGGEYEEAFVCERRYGDGFIPALFGANVNFDDASGHPFAEPLLLDDGQVERLEVPDFANHPVVVELFDKSKGGYGRSTGEIGNEGVVNIAYKLRGENMFLDLLERPGLFRHLCDVVWATIDGVMHLVREWQGSGRLTHIVNCDCLINMISPDLYREHLLPYERRFSESFDLFGIHTCNWKVDPYLPAISDVRDRLNYLDMGSDSDIGRVHDLFPDIEPAVFYHPEKLRRFSRAQVAREIDELCRKLGKGTILLSDLEAGTSDSVIRDVFEVASRY